MPSIRCSVVAATSFWTAVIAQSVSLAIQPQPTAGASEIISPSFAGFGIEPSNLYSFTGGESNTNHLSINLLANLGNYTGTPPHLRVGGNTQDNIIYESSQNDYQVAVNPNPIGQGAYPTDEYIIGPKFFEVLNRFPSNTPITYGLNMAYEDSDYLSRIMDTANAAYSQLSNLNLVSFEIGNEPDLYLENAFRNGTWNGQVYTQQWLTRADYLWENLLHPKGIRANFFEPGATASTIGTSFMIEDLVQDGITVTANDSTKSYVLSWNQHDYYYYIGVSTYDLTIDHFMEWSTTNDQFSAWFSQLQQADQSGLPYALREMGVVGPIGMDGITNVFGASLWTLNFFMYAATLNISSVQMHMTDNSNASAWQPIPYYGMEPHVRPNYYAWAAFDQIVGGSCQAQIGGYDFSNLPTGYVNYVSGYSVWQNSVLDTIVLINGKVHNTTASSPAGTLTVNLALPTQFAGQTLYLSYLTAEGADSKVNTTWNGISYEVNGDGTPTQVNSTVQTLSIGSDGSVAVPVRDTQAVAARIGSPVGGVTVNSSACAALAAKTPDATPVATPVGTNSADGAKSTSSSSSGSSSSSKSSASATATARTSVAAISTMILGTLFASLGSGFYILFG